MAERTQTLGTLFTADIKNFMSMTRQIKTRLNMLATAANQLKSSLNSLDKTASGGRSGISSMGSELSEFQLAMGRATNESKGFQQALATLGKGKTGTALQTVEKTVRKVETAIQQTAASMNAAGKDGKAYEQSANRLSLAQQLLAGHVKITNDGIMQTAKANQKASASTKAHTASVSRASSTTKSLSSSIFGQTQATNRASVATGKLGKQLTVAQGAAVRMYRAFKVIASYGTVGAVFAAITGAIAGFKNEIFSLDQGLMNLQAITGATGGEIAALKERILEIAKTTKFSGSELAQALVILGQAGFDASEALNAIDATAYLATGTLTDMQSTADLLTTTIRAFGLESMDAMRVADVMANAINKSKLTMDKLRTAFNYVGATAHQAGMTLEQTAATLMVLANHGLRASTMGTGLRQVLARLISPNRKLRSALEAQGVAVADLDIKQHGFQAVMMNLGKVLWDAEKQTVDMSKAFELFGLRGAQAAAVLIKGFNSSAWTNALKKVYEVGTAERMAATQAEGLIVIAKNMADTFRVLAVEVGDHGLVGSLKLLLTSIKGVGDAMIWFVQNPIGGFITEAGMVTVVIYGIVKAIGALQSILVGTTAWKWFAALAANVGTLRASYTALMVVLSKIGPWGAIAAGVGVAITAFNRFRQENEKAITASVKASASHRELASNVEVYAAALESLHPKYGKDTTATLEYDSTLKRLQKTLRDASVDIDVMAMSHDEMVRAMKDLSVSERAKEFNQYAETLGRTDVEIKKIYAESKMFDGALNALGLSSMFVDEKQTALGKTIKEFAQSNSDAAKSAKEHGVALDGLTVGLSEMIFMGEKSVSEVDAMIDNWKTFGKFSDETANKLKENVATVVSEMENAAKKSAAETKKAIEALPPEFQKMLSGLSELETFYFAQAVQKMNKNIAERKKVLDQWVKTQKISEEKAEKAIKQVREEALIEFKNSLVEKETALEKHAKTMLGIRIAIERQTLELQDDSVQKFKDLMAIELKEYENSMEHKRLLAEGQTALIEQAKLNIVTEYEQKITQFEIQEAEKRITLLRANTEAQVAEFNNMVANKQMTAEAAAQRIAEVEQATSEQIVSIWSGVKEQIAQIHGESSDLYEQASLKKIEAENAVKDAMTETLEATKSAASETSDLFEHRIDQLKSNAQKEIAVVKEAVATKVKSEAEGAAEIARIEENFCKKVVEMWKQRVAEMARIYGKNSDEYRNAVKKKLEAEQSYLDATIKSKAAIEELNRVTSEYGKISKNATDTAANGYNKVTDAANNAANAIGNAAGASATGSGAGSASGSGSASPTVGSFRTPLNSVEDYTKEIERVIVQMASTTNRAFRKAQHKYLQTLKSELKRIHEFKEQYGYNEGGFIHAAFGRYLPGYGGGDRVPILAEAGEGVIRKEVVRAFGGKAFIDSLNNMSFNPAAVPQTDQVSAAGQNGRGQSRRMVIEKNIINLSTMFGDESSMRKAGIQIRKQLNELDRRYSGKG